MFKPVIVNEENGIKVPMEDLEKDNTPLFDPIDNEPEDIRRGWTNKVVKKLNNLQEKAKKDIYKVSKSDIAYAFQERGLYREANSLEECCQTFIHYRCEHDEHHNNILPKRCGLRVCPECGERKIRQLKDRFKAFFKDIKKNRKYRYMRFRRFELSMRPVKDEDYGPHVYKHIAAAATDLFSKKLFKDALGDDGGILWTTETKYTRPGDVYERRKKDEFHKISQGGWNVHIHGFMYSKKITRKDLSKAWSHSTTKIYIKTGFENLRNVFYTHIDEAKDFRGKTFNQIAWGYGLFEAVKYVMKPPSLKSADNFALYFEATQGLRLTRTKGAFYHMKVLKKPEKRKPLCGICGGEMIQEDFGLNFSEAKEILAKNRIKADNLVYYLNNFSPNIVWVKDAKAN